MHVVEPQDEKGKEKGKRKGKGKGKQEGKVQRKVVILEEEEARYRRLWDLGMDAAPGPPPKGPPTSSRKVPRGRGRQLARRLDE